MGCLTYVVTLKFTTTTIPILTLPLRCATVIMLPLILGTSADSKIKPITQLHIYSKYDLFSMSTHTSANGYASTYDSTHGWLMWEKMSDSGDREVAQYSKDSKSFGTFPVPWWVKGVDVQCLETLDNGGDIFVAGSESVYIYRHADSTWEKQPDVPEEVDECKSDCYKKK